MEKTYKNIWKLAKPYYKKGRPMDIAHISWMMLEIEKVCKLEKLDDTIVIPLVILHDVGYGISEQTYFEKNKKEAHMVAGAKLAKSILKKVYYPPKKIKAICKLIKIHDYWIYKNYSIYKRNKLLWIFNDLDFIWLVSPKGFEIVRKVISKNKKEMIDYIKLDPRHKKLGFSCKSTRLLYNFYMHRLFTK
jgi:hypothetical protein